MRLSGALLLLAILASSPAGADVISARPDSVALTLYHEGVVNTADLAQTSNNAEMREEGLAFITETRTIDVPEGPAVIRFRGVASTMVPQTAMIEGLPAGAIEKNFDYDLLTPGSLLAKSIGETVRLVRTDAKTGKLAEESAIVRSGPQGAMLEIAGKLEAFRCSGLPEKLVFDHVPEGLTDTPTLTVRTMSPKAGRYTITLSYIATGLNWSADYVARAVPGTQKLALSGWLTLANFSDTSFANAPVSVVAGRLSTTGDDTPPHPSSLVFATNCWPMNIDWGKYTPLARRLLGRGKPAAIQMVPLAVRPPGDTEEIVVTAQKRINARQLGDYKLYPLPEPTTVAARQTKQIQFLDQDSVAYQRLYGYIAYGDEPDRSDRPFVFLRIQNDSDDGLGKPLPGGIVHVFEHGADSVPVFSGEDGIPDIPVGLPAEVNLCGALDLRVDAELVSSKTTGVGHDRIKHNVIHVAIANDRSEAIVFEFRKFLIDGTAVVAESRPHVLDRGSALWRFDLAPGQVATLDYSLDVRED